MARRLNDSENRWGARIRVSIPVRVAGPREARIDGRIKNLSLSGALVTTDLAAPLNARIAVTVPLPASSQGHAVIEAQVARRASGDMGVEWCQFAPTAVKELLRSPSIRLPL